VLCAGFLEEPDPQEDYKAGILLLRAGFYDYADLCGIFRRRKGSEK
jgi:hypothetical protein